MTGKGDNDEPVKPTVRVVQPGEAPEDASPTILVVEDKEAMLRRQFFAFMTASMSAVTDPERLAAVAAGLCQVDGRLVEQMEATTDHYAGRFWSTSPELLWPALRGHLTTLHTLLMTTPARHRPELQSLMANASAMAGRCAFVLDNRGDAAKLWAQAMGLAVESGDRVAEAQTLIQMTSLYSSIPHNGRGADTRRAIELLDAAEATLPYGSYPYMYAWLFARRAEEHAVLNHDDQCVRDLERAHRHVSQAPPTGKGYFAPWRPDRLAGYEGLCYLRLGTPKHAIEVLKPALAKHSERFPGHRAAILGDLAAAYVYHEPEHAANLLGEGLALAMHADMRETGERLVATYQRHMRFQELRHTPAMQRLDEQIRTLL